MLRTGDWDKRFSTFLRGPFPLHPGHVFSIFLSFPIFYIRSRFSKSEKSRKEELGRGYIKVQVRRRGNKVSYIFAFHIVPIAMKGLDLAGRDNVRTLFWQVVGVGTGALFFLFSFPFVAAIRAGWLRDLSGLTETPNESN